MADHTRSTSDWKALTCSTSAAAQGYLLNLLRQSVEQPTVDGWLRVARWQMWSRNTRGALDATAFAANIAVNSQD